MNAYEKENRIKYAPKDQLIAVMQGQSDAYPQWMALAELNARREQGVALTGEKAKQQLAQGKQTVKDRRLSEMLPELLGIGQLPAPNMEALAAADGGIVGYADGGEVERYQAGGLPEGYEWFEDPTSGEVYQRKKRAGLYDYGLSLQEKAQGIKPPPPAAPLTTKAPAAAPAAPGVEPVKAPEGVKKAVATVAQPKVPVGDPTKAEVSNLDRTLASTEKLYDFLDKKFGDQLAPVKEQLQRDRDEYKNMKSENVGLALLGAAGALLKPGRSTASAIGEGLGTLAEYGSKFQPQLLAARQGISAGEIGLAQAQAQAARGNFGTAAQLVGQEQTRALQERELAAKEPLYKAQAQYYGARASDTVGGGTNNMAQLRLYASQLDKAIKAFGIPTSAADKLHLEDLKRQRADLMKRLGPGGGSLSGALSALPQGAVVANP